MDDYLVSIGAVAEAFGIAASTLRYYEAQGLVHPAGLLGGRRYYGIEQLRRLALVKMYIDTGMTLRQVRSLIEPDTTAEEFRTALGDQIVTLEQRIAAATRAKAVLEHHLTCSRPFPMQCPWLIDRLDDRLGLAFGGAVTPPGA